MANNYQLFSETLPALTKPEQDWIQRVLGWTQLSDDGVDSANLLKEAGIDLDAVELDDWPGFESQIDGCDLWLYAEECGNVSHVAEFMIAFLARFRPADCWQLTWAVTCSRPRIGEFSGGGLFVTATRAVFYIPHDWLARQKKKFERAAKT